MTASTRARIRLVNLQVLELEGEPPVGYRGNVAVTEQIPAHFAREAEWLYQTNIKEGCDVKCATCDSTAIGWEFDEGAWGQEPDWNWRYSVMVTTDGGQTVRTLCEDCAGDIGPEVIFV